MLFKFSARLVQSWLEKITKYYNTIRKSFTEDGVLKGTLDKTCSTNGDYKRIIYEIDVSPMFFSSVKPTFVDVFLTSVDKLIFIDVCKKTMK